MRYALALLALIGSAQAATVATVTPGDWALYRSTTIVSRHATEAACVAAAKALNVARTYTCRTSTGVAVTITPDVCTAPQPAAEMQTMACPAGTTGSWQQSRSYVAAPFPTCWTAGAWTPASAPAGACVTPPPSGPGPKITLNPTTYAVGGYSTLIWSGTLPCTASADPAYGPWSGPKSDYGQSVAPNVSTVFTLTCANGTATASLTVTGSVTPPPSGGGGGGGSTPPPPETLPVPPVLPSPIVLAVTPMPAGDPVADFSQTARRNWNHGGHNVAVPFSTDYGYWDYENCATHYSTWLFDRPSAWFKYAELTGDATARDLAISDFRYWVGKIDAQGYFSCKTGEQDSKYLYIEPFIRYEAATGDQQFRAVADRVYAASATGFPSNYSPSYPIWTEREVGIHLGAALDYYRLTGNTQALARAAALVRQWSEVAGTVGAPLVTETKHEGGGPAPNELTSSPWMSALYFQSARRYWQITGDEAVLRQASAYFDWLDANALYDGSLAHPEFTGVTFPRYLTGNGVGDSFPDESNMLHCPDVGGFVHFAVDAKRRLGLPTARAQQRETELKACTARMWQNWTRDTNYLPKYRVAAPRSWNWWMSGLYESAR